MDEHEAFVSGWNPAQPVAHLVAEAAGRVVGYGVAYKASWVLPDRMYCHVAVTPKERRRGAGGALFDALLRFALAHELTYLTSEVQDDDEPAVAWAERRGFVKRHHFFDSVLRLGRFNDSAFAGHVERVEAEGIRFITLAAIQSPAVERKLYDFFHELLLQTPNGADTAQATFADWREFLLGRHGWPEGIVLAVNEKGRWVGLTALRRTVPERAHIAFTGVAADCRGRGIALAAKLKAIEIMRRAGIAEVETVNHAANGPMLAVNRKLGYEPQPGHYFMYKQMSRAK